MTAATIAPPLPAAEPPRGLEASADALAIAREVLAFSRREVRSRTRTERYFGYTDRFAHAFLCGPLGAPPALCSTLGSDLPALLDTCYEETMPLGAEAIPALVAQTARFAAVLDPEAALSTLLASRKDIGIRGRPLAEIATSTLAALTLLGFRAVESRDSREAAERWLSLWRARTLRHNTAQLHHTAICLIRTGRVEMAKVASAIPPSSLEGWPRGTTFASGVDEYLDRFADTAGASMALTGALPFAEDLPGRGIARLGEWLSATPEYLFAIDSTLRLAQDVPFDAEEPLSSAVAGVAAELGLPVTTVALAFPRRATLAEDLRRHWVVHEARLREALSRVLFNATVETEQRHLLRTFVEVTFSIALALTNAPHKA
ncbi:MAG: hypothetical protein U0441_12685 [Polyangiaceae bacterium]